MKRIRIASTVLCFLLFAAFANASPQQDEPKSKDASPAMQQPEEKPETKPEKQEQKPDEMKPEKNEKQDKEQEKENKDQEKQEKKEDKNSGKEMGNMRNENQGNAHAAGGHIPDNKFRSSFGRSHTFHPSRPTVVNGRPTFAYGGYSFILVDPWPAGWAYTDDCYIDYIDGQYFLFDLAHPGVQIALMVSL